MQIDCPGVVVTDANGVAICEDMEQAPLAWVEVPKFDLEDVDSEIAGEAFVAGFIIVGTAWAIGFGVRALLSMVKR